jgi:DNA-binding transcriptional MerR regulator
MRTSEAAAQAGVNVQTLRYYERRGMLPAPARRGAGYRDYPPEAVRVVRFSKRAQALGFSLAEVQALLELADGGPDSCDAARELAAHKIADLDRRIACLQAMRGSLEQLVATCQRPRTERECPLLPAIERLDCRRPAKHRPATTSTPQPGRPHEQGDHQRRDRRHGMRAVSAGCAPDAVVLAPPGGRPVRRRRPARPAGTPIRSTSGPKGRRDRAHGHSHSPGAPDRLPDHEDLTRPRNGGLRWTPPAPSRSPSTRPSLSS